MSGHSTSSSLASVYTPVGVYSSSGIGGTRSITSHAAARSATSFTL